MSKTVYILGAGVNQSISHYNNSNLHPPLGKNFFRIAFSLRRFKSEYYISKIRTLFDYIRKNWAIDLDFLESKDFEIEEIFSKLESDFDNSSKNDDTEKKYYLQKVYIQFTAFLLEVLKEFGDSADLWGFDFENKISHDYICRLAKKIFSEKAITITFNYDTILEKAFETVSGLTRRLKLSVENPSTSFYKWNRSLSYGFKFDKLKLYKPGVPEYVKGENFYSINSNRLYSYPILKLHGSLNWFTYSNVRSTPFENEQQLPDDMKDKIILCEGQYHLASFPDFDGWKIIPTIIPPIKNKQDIIKHNPIFKNIWSQAETALQSCDRLIVIGFRFSESDKYILEIFKKSLNKGSLKSVILVSRDSTGSVIETLKKYTGFNNIIKYSNLEEYTK